MQETLLTVTVVVCTVVALALLMRALKQPVIISYLLAGLVVSPYGLNLLHSTEELELFSQMGVSFLLFLVGMNLNPRVVKEVGKVSLVAGMGQVVFTAAVGYVLGRLLGFAPVVSLYVAVALTFSSTIIVMKLLTDAGELETLHGRISTGFLIVQDVIAMLLLVAVSSMDGGTEGWEMILGRMALRGLTLASVLLVAGLFLLPWLLKAVAASQELLLLFSIGWCFAIAALSFSLGLSMEIGALAAGIVLSLSPYRFEIGAKLRPMRDFFIVIFFVLLGSQLVLDDVAKQLVAVAVFSLFVLVGNPLIIMFLMGRMRYTKRTGFRTGMALAQVSEFSFILVALGVRLGHVPPSVLSFVTFVGLLTIALSTYGIHHAERLYGWLQQPLSLFERQGKKVDEHLHMRQKDHDILLLGYERIGLNVLEALRKMRKSFLVVDYNPKAITELAKEGIDCKYGDLGDAELLEELDFGRAKMVVSTLRDFDTTVLIVRAVRAANKDAIVIVVSQQVDEALHLYQLGASYVITPQFLSGYHTSLLIEEYGLDLKKFLTEKARHLEHLKFSHKRMKAVMGRK
ncbi:MAG: cation:proton antiporter [Candidatus Peribacteraceae bacterium]|jgi:Kef-type K+ transport system membrane component KefB